MEYHFELGEKITRPLMDEIKELEDIKRKVKKLIKSARKYPYDETDMKTVIKNLEEILKDKK